MLSSSEWMLCSHSSLRKSRQLRSAHSGILQCSNESWSVVSAPAQLRQHICGSQIGTNPGMNPTICHVASFVAIARHASRCVRPSVTPVQICSVRGLTSVET